MGMSRVQFETSEELSADTHNLRVVVRPDVSGAVVDQSSRSPSRSGTCRSLLQRGSAICQRDGGRLWGVSLCGPMVFADARTRTPSQTSLARPRNSHDSWVRECADRVGRLALGRLHVGLYDLPGECAHRAMLMLHELFHRIQPDLGLITLSGNNAHLDTVEGRIWLRLEWRALARALGQSGEDRKRAVSDAAAFRLTRRSQFANSAENERVEEIREGLAQYTGTVAAAASHAEAVASAIEQLAAAEQHETFLQQAYTTGVAYGILLDDRVSRTGGAECAATPTSGRC